MLDNTTINFIEGLKFNDKECFKLESLSEQIRRNAQIYDYNMKCEKIKNILVNQLNYNNWIILYDLTLKNYYSISNDIRKNKININDVIEVINLSNNIENIFDKNEILELIKTH